jgi:hypothetical protein
MAHSDEGKASDYFIFISYCIIKRIANFIGSTPIHGRGGGGGGFDEEKNMADDGTTVMDSIFAFAFLAD